MEKNLAVLLNDVTSLKNKDISHSTLGIDNNFSESEKIKNDIIEYNVKLIENLDKYYSKVPKVIIDDVIRIIKSQYDAIYGQINTIQQLVDGGIHKPEYPGNRNTYIAQFQKYETSFTKELFRIDQLLKVENLIETMNSSDELNIKIEQTQSDLGEIEKLKAKAKDQLGELSDLSLVKSLKESAGSFDKLRENHSGYEKKMVYRFFGFNYFFSWVSSCNFFVGFQR